MLFSQLACWQVLRAIFYPPLPGSSELHTPAGRAATKGDLPDVQLSCGEHSDYGLLTFVLQEDTVTALQVLAWPAAKRTTALHICLGPAALLDSRDLHHAAALAVA